MVISLPLPLILLLAPLSTPWLTTGLLSLLGVGLLVISQIPTGTMFMIPILPFLHHQLSFTITSITINMLYAILFLGCTISLFAFEYLAGDPRRLTFFVRFMFFIAMMAMLAMASDLLTLFLCWEGIGIASFLLIGFWSNRIQACKASLKAMLMNRFGDFGFVLIYCATNPTTIGLINSDATATNWIAGIGILIALAGKSAQLGLHTWLPDAMEGPTPVSALLHAATLVTAGIILIVQMNMIVGDTSWLFAWGGMTCLTASAIAWKQTDLKKMIAFSTMSQLGFMLLGWPSMAAVNMHLFTHAGFKALLFIAAGLIIHTIHTQDVREMGGMSWCWGATLLGTATAGLIGIAGTSGAISKDWLLGTWMGWGTGITMCLGLMTIGYGLRGLIGGITGSPKCGASGVAAGSDGSGIGIAMGMVSIAVLGQGTTWGWFGTEYGNVESMGWVGGIWLGIWITGMGWVGWSLGGNTTVASWSSRLGDVFGMGRGLADTAYGWLCGATYSGWLNGQSVERWWEWGLAGQTATNWDNANRRWSNNGGWKGAIIGLVLGAGMWMALSGFS